MYVITQEDSFLYGIDWSGPVTESDENIVTLPDTPSPLPPNDFEELYSTISPLADSENHGVDIYLETLAFVTRKLF